MTGRQTKSGSWEPRIDAAANRWVVQNMRTLEVAQTAPRGKGGTMDRRFKDQGAAQAAADKLNAAELPPLDYKAIAIWALGPGTSASSKCLASYLMGLETNGSYPTGDGGFASCERLLSTVPGLRQRLAEMASCNRYWAALVPRWEEIREARDKQALIEEIVKPLREGEPFNLKRPKFPAESPARA